MSTFTTNNKIICYETYGDPAQPCIMLTHGIGSQLTFWPESFLQTLADYGFYVVVLDNRDSGLSHSYDELHTPPFGAVMSGQEPMAAPPYTLDDMAHDMVLLMDHLNLDKAHIGGISMGGMISQVFALNHPERIASLICIATTSGDKHLPPPQQALLDFLMSQPNTEVFETVVANKIEACRLYTNNTDYFDEDLAREASTRAYQRAYNPKGFARQLYAVVFAEPRGEKLKQLTIPSLVIHGTCDPMFPLEHAEYLSQVLPQNSLVCIQGMGHGLLNPFSDAIAKAIAEYVKGIK